MIDHTTNIKYSKPLKRRRGRPKLSSHYHNLMIRLAVISLCLFQHHHHINHNRNSYNFCHGFVSPPRQILFQTRKISTPTLPTTNNNIKLNQEKKNCNSISNNTDSSNRSKNTNKKNRSTAISSTSLSSTTSPNNLEMICHEAQQMQHSHKHWMNIATEMLEEHLLETDEQEQEYLSENDNELLAWTEIMANETAGTTDILSNRILRRKMAVLLQQGIDILYPELKDMSVEDNEQIELYWDRILPQVSYLGSANAAKIKQALRVACRAHLAQKRKSGEPFVIHPVEVALLLAELKMDAESIMAGLLHDTVEDTDLTFEQIEAMFGFVVRSIVEGETKVSKLPKLAFSDYADEQAENLRQMFVAMTDDYRIIIVKLADRLHNMRTLRYMKPEKQKKISRETLDIFAPLAHRMGIWQFKSELEDTAFMYLYPSEYKRLNKILRKHQTRFRDTLDKSQEILRKTLASDVTLTEQTDQIKVYGRTKELYSLWHKMVTKVENNIDQIADVVALRVILYPKDANDNNISADRGVWLCYHVLGLVQHLPGFQVVPTRVKDYISFPKQNGYQSLHTELLFDGQMVEVQIRTSSMHQIAEYGMASHWAYTNDKKMKNGKGAYELYNTPWLSSIKEWQEDFVCARDFVECVRRELLGKRVFVFLRNGKILNLAKGATAIDAAFRIHTEVGLTMEGAEINGKPVPLSYELKNGDVVSIITGKEGRPATDWMLYAKIRSTRSKLRSYFRSKQRESFLKAGAILLDDFLDRHSTLLQSLSTLGEDQNSIPTCVDEFNLLLPGAFLKYENIDELLIEIGKKTTNRSFLRCVVSKVCQVPLSALEDAESSTSPVTYSIPSSSSSRSSLIQQPSGSKFENFKKIVNVTSSFIQQPQQQTQINDNMNDNNNNADSNYMISYFDDNDGSTLSKEYYEYADLSEVEICNDCLPIPGDQIMGTRIPDNEGYFITTVHRCGCIHAIPNNNYVNTNNNILSNDKTTQENVSSGTSSNNRFSFSSSQTQEQQFNQDLQQQNPIKFKWDYDAINNNPSQRQQTFLVELIVIANDRKLLLADCSQIVSEKSDDILKTSSSTTDEHAKLEYLVKVKDLYSLQKLMDYLRDVTSVMSVERRFGSELYRK